MMHSEIWLKLRLFPLSFTASSHYMDRTVVIKTDNVIV